MGQVCSFHAVLVESMTDAAQFKVHDQLWLVWLCASCLYVRARVWFLGVGVLRLICLYITWRLGFMVALLLFLVDPGLVLFVLGPHAVLLLRPAAARWRTSDKHEQVAAYM